MSTDTFILGAGMTGLAASVASGLTVYEAEPAAGGICLSYYVRPNTSEMLGQCPEDEEVYRFENGGGHWIFGGDPSVLHYMNNLVEMKQYARLSSVYFPDTEQYVPYPLQNFLHCLQDQPTAKILAEIARPAGQFSTMSEWVSENFGDTLGKLFFDPFHDLYTAGLYETIAPQDAYKSPVNVETVLRGALENVPPVGYNTTFVYPKAGLNTLSQRMAEQANVEYGKRVERINPQQQAVYFADGSEQHYQHLISTLPLNVMMDKTGLSTEAKPDPHSSVLVLNIGAVRGDRCPDDHWLYIPHSDAGFHRVGFYSNVDTQFLPKSARANHDRVSIYVEKGYAAGTRPDEAAQADYAQAVVKQLQQWGFIKDAEVVHPTWIDVAYTWSWPNSNWKSQATKTLQDHNIFQVGRYARWTFQGIADSIRDGFIAGNSFKP